MTSADIAIADEHHDHDDHHGHGRFIAHHFDSAEQQFDSGKLGIWLFLTTEILFFSGLFLLYTLYRYHHPEIFVNASEFLDKILGGINTVVLLFSSLTMAWAVRSAQLGNNRFCARLILITMVCAAVFLGIKAVEYSHKWDLRIFPISKYNFDAEFQPAPPEMAIAKSLGISDYLVGLSVLPAILLAGFLGGAGIAAMTGRKLLSTFLFGLAIMMGGYFLGAVGGQIYETVAHGSHDAEHAAHAATNNHGPSGDVAPTEVEPQRIGVFFSIYYCMTGLHAFHVIFGMLFLSWLFYRSLNQHWRPDYFGPVDYVGLYWHVVDLIWIFLFPLLYLIK
jgi:cytochrome c oxidase subunit III